MPLLAADLIAPKGEIEASLFPGETVATRLDAYLAEAYAKPEVAAADSPDRAARAWAYHRAYKAVFLRLSSSPAQFSMGGDGGHGYTNEQILAFQRLADEAMRQYESAVTVRASRSTLGTTSVSNQFVP